MVHFKPKVPNTWGKSFLTSVMGTTISILLTFGTSALVERKVKADVQRQTAMMVIHDIDVCADQMEEMANNPFFSEPITFDEYNQLMIDSKANNYNVDYAAFLKEKLKDRKVQFFIDQSASRARYYRNHAQRWKDISDRNKFIMDIGDEELAEYIKNSQRSGISISKRDLMGQWERKASGYEDYYYEFLENDSFCRKVISHYANPFYNGEINMTYKHSGVERITTEIA